MTLSAMSTGVKPWRSGRKLIVFAAAAVLLAAVGWYVRNHVSLAEVADHERRLREYISLRPWRSFFAGFAVYAGLSLVPGTGGKAMVYGWLFGFWRALIIVTVGLALAAMAIFSLSRYLFQEIIERRHPIVVSLMNRHIEKEGAFYLLILRMAHAPYSIVNPVSGASRVRVWTFFWTTVVGLLPASAIWIYVGIRLPSLHELASRGPDAFIDLPLIAALVACPVLPLLVRWLVNRFGIPVMQKPKQGGHHHESQGAKA